MRKVRLGEIRWFSKVTLLVSVGVCTPIQAFVTSKPSSYLTSVLYGYFQNKCKEKIGEKGVMLIDDQGWEWQQTSKPFNAYCVAGTVNNALHILTHLILIRLLISPLFQMRKPSTERYVTCPPKPQRQRVIQSGFNPGNLAAGSTLLTTSPGASYKQPWRH